MSTTFGHVVARAKLIGDIPRTAVGTLQHGLQSLEVPGSVSTDGWNINQDGSIVGNYKSADGRTHGFIARLTTEEESRHFGNFYTTTLSKGLNMLSVPLAPPKPMTAKSLVAMTGATTIITLDASSQRFIAWTPSASDDGFPLKVEEAISSMSQKHATLLSSVPLGQIQLKRLLPHPLLLPR